MLRIKQEKRPRPLGERSGTASSCLAGREKKRVTKQRLSQRRSVGKSVRSDFDPKLSHKLDAVLFLEESEKSGLRRALLRLYRRQLESELGVAPHGD